MASTYPTSLDAFTNPTTTDPQNNPSHAGQHSDANDAIEALEAKLGIGASPAASATEGQVLTRQGDGTTAWQSATSVAWLPAQLFTAASGTPSLTHIGGNGIRPPAWLFDAASDEYVASVWEVPRGWSSVDIELRWANVGAGSGDVAWVLQTQASSGAGFNWNTGTTTTHATVVTTAGAQYVQTHSVLKTGLAVTPDTELGLRFLRNASAGGDTLGNDAGAMGLRITRVA